MAAGKITLQANDGKTLSLVAPEGMVANTTEVVTTPLVIHNATSKTTPADNDEFALLDSDSTFSLKKLTFANLKATLLSYFDTLYSRTSAIFGIGQTWQNVTANRSSGVTYTNTTGKPIFINICMDTYNSYQKIEVDGIDISGNEHMGGGNPVFVVPNGSTYKFVSTNTGILTSWCELR